MIMPKRGYGRTGLPIELEGFYKKSTNFWITDKGELIQCKDHEEAARKFIKDNNLLLECVDWMKDTRYEHRDYRSFVTFSKGWIRLITGENPMDGVGISLSTKITEPAFNSFSIFLHNSLTSRCTVDTFYEDNGPEMSVEYSSKNFNKMLKVLKELTQ